MRRWISWLTTGGAFVAACSSSPLAHRSEGLEVEKLPVDVRADYAVFAERCTKCHSATRALNSGITDDDQWELYVTRMRRQPSSGISETDAKTVLRFLHYYSAEQLRAKSDRDGGR